MAMNELHAQVVAAFNEAQERKASTAMRVFSYSMLEIDLEEVNREINAVKGNISLARARLMGQDFSFIQSAPEVQKIQELRAQLRGLNERKESILRKMFDLVRFPDEAFSLSDRVKRMEFLEKQTQ